MERSTTGERAVTTFVRAARAAIEKHVAEARTGAAEWRPGAGIIWVRWPRPDGTWFGLALRRHLDWVTGEASLAREAGDPEALPLWTGEGTAAPNGYRIRLGVLLHDEDRWWPGSAARSIT